MNKKTLWIMFLLISFLGTVNGLAADNPIRLSDISPGTYGGHPNNYVTFNGKLYFNADDDISGFELWVYDGINPPTMVADIYPGAYGSNPLFFKVFQDKLYFCADDANHGAELCVYDGINPPTMVADIWLGGYSSNPTALAVFNNRLYFSAGDGRAHGYELFEYDGMNAPRLVADINKHLDYWGNSEGSFPYGFKVFNNKLYFGANDGDFGSELWEYDGVLPPRRITDLNTIPSMGSNPRFFTEFKGELYFSACKEDGNYELWKYNGLSQPIQVSFPQKDPYPGCMTELNNRLYFYAKNNIVGWELWSFDGIGTPTPVTDINPGINNSISFNNNSNIINYSGKLYFQATNGVSGFELWSYDGIVSEIISDIYPGEGNANPLHLITFNDRLFFTADDGVYGKELWAYQQVSITVTEPNGGENWNVNSNQSITWTSTGTIANVKLEYSINNGDSWNIISESTENDGNYPWTIPDTISSQCLIKASDAGGTTFDVSDAVFSIIVNPTITVTAPNGGEIWEGGSAQNIIWTSTGTIANVKLEYSTNNGIFWNDISSSVVNNGSYSWTVSNTPASTCLVKISDATGTITDTSDATFTITAQKTITVTAPNSGEIWEGGSAQNIIWTSTGAIANVKLEYSINSGTSWNIISTSTANSGSYGWIVANTPASTCLVKVSDAVGTVSDTSNAIFTITAQKTITVTTPNGGESWEGGSLKNITWTSTGAITNVKLEYSINSGSSWNTISASTANSGSYSWTVANTPASTCLVKVSDAAGTVSDTSNATFTITSQRTITVTTPNGGEIWRINTYQYIRWNWTGTIANVKIEYSTNNGSTWKLIASSITNTGSYRWRVTSPASTTCKVRISATSGSPSDTSNSVFRIRN